MTTCSQCAACCHNVSVEVDEADSWDEIEEYRWLLMHEGVSLYIDDNKWYVEYDCKCKSLAPDGTCSIYKTRPKTCREYDPDSCLANGDDEYYEHYFKEANELVNWWKKTHPKSK